MSWFRKTAGRVAFARGLRLSFGPTWLTRRAKGTVMMASVCAPMCPASDLMRLYDYSEVRPPTNLLTPGTLVVVTRRNPIKAKVLCGPRASLGDDWEPQASRTMSTEMRKLEGRNFKLEADVMSNIKGVAKFDDIESVTMTITNASVLELTDLDVEEGMLKRDPSCHSVVRKRLQAGFPVTMVRSSLAADVVYKISRSASSTLEGKARVEQMSQLAIELGGGAVKISESTITSTGLIFGIRDDEYLAALSIPELDESEVEPGTRHIPTQSTAHILPVAEAPIRLPAGHRPSMEIWRPNGDGTYAVPQPIPMRARGAPIYDSSLAPMDSQDLDVAFAPSDDEESLELRPRR